MTEIIKSKLEIPLLNVRTVERNRLFEKVSDFENRKALCITAAAGYGKTVFTRQLVNRSGLPFMWYQLDPTDNDPMQFILYLLSGLEKAVPGFHVEIPDFKMDGTAGKETLLILSPLLAELNEKAKKGLLLVFDDFHFISEPVILRFVERFLIYMPHFVHIVFVCRFLPPINLLRLKADGNVAEITQVDLEFNKQEITSLFESSEADDSVIGQFGPIIGKMHGWALGLSVIKLMIGDSKAQFSLIACNQGKDELFHFFMNDLMKDLPEIIRDFLKKTSVLEALTLDACNFVAGTECAERNLAFLTDKNLFIYVSVFDGKISYRYHPLFREFLQSQLGSEKESAYTSAGEYYESQGLFSQAAECYMSARRSDLVFDLAKKEAIPLLNERKIKTVGRWLRYLDSLHLLSSPELILAQGAYLSCEGNFDSAEKWIDRAVALSRQTGDRLELFRATVHKARILRYRASFNESLQIFENLTFNMAGIPFRDQAEAVTEKVYSLWLSGNARRALEVAEDALLKAKSCNDKDAEQVINFLSGYMCVLYYNQGEYTDSLLYYNKALEANCHNYDALESFSVNLFAAWICRERGEPAKAVSMMKESLERKKRLDITEDLHLVYYNLALACYDLHDNSRAVRYMNLAAECFQGVGGNLEEYSSLLRLIEHVIFCETIVDPKTAEEEADHCVLKLLERKDGILIYASFHIGVGYIRLGQNEKALRFIQTPLGMCRKTGLKQFVALLSGLTANILLQQDKADEAVGYVRECMKLSAAEKYMQSFLTYPEMKPCLLCAMENQIEPEFTRCLLKRLDRNARPLLQRLFKSTNPRVRISAVRLLSETFGASELGEYGFLFFDDNAQVRAEAFNQLNKHGENSAVRLIVRCFGTFSVFLPQDCDTPVKWRTEKAKELFAYFVHWKQTPVPTERILADIWPDFDSEKARNLFHTNLTYVKSVLSKNDLRNAIGKKQSGYYLDPSGILSDSWCLDNEEYRDFAGRICKGEYLENIYSDWPMEKRAAFEINYGK